MIRRPVPLESAQAWATKPGNRKAPDGDSMQHLLSPFTSCVRDVATAALATNCLRGRLVTCDDVKLQRLCDMPVPFLHEVRFCDERRKEWASFQRLYQTAFHNESLGIISSDSPQLIPVQLAFGPLAALVREAGCNVACPEILSQPS